MVDTEIRVPTGLTTEGLLGRRYLARFIDTLIIGGLIGIASALATAVAPPIAAGALILLVCLVVWIGYAAGLESSSWQATIGKRFLGLRVYDSRGGRMAPLQAAGRNLVKDGPFLLFGLIPGAQLLSLVWIAAHLIVLHRSPVYQAIHDRVAHTWVAAPEGTTRLHLT